MSHEHDPSASSESEPVTEARRAHAGEGFFLLLAGFAVTGFGAALVAAPHVSWQLTKVARTLSAQGVEGFSVATFGALLFGLGWVARSSAVASSRAATEAAAGLATDDADEGTDVGLVVEQVAGDLASTRSQVAHVDARLEAVSGRIEELVVRSEEHDESPGGMHQNALFQLASSLDKLQANFDRRLDDRMAVLAAQVEGVIDALGELREQVETTAAAPAPVAEAEPVAPAEPEPAVATEPAPAPEPAPEPVAESAYDAAPDPDLTAELARQAEAHLPLDELDRMAEPEDMATEPMEVYVELESDEPAEHEPQLDFFDALGDLDGECEPVEQKLDLDTLDLDQLGSDPAPPAGDSGGITVEDLDALLPDENVQRSLEREQDNLLPPEHPL
jgi:TolA-binding protein